MISLFAPNVKTVGWVMFFCLTKETISEVKYKTFCLLDKYFGAQPVRSKALVNLSQSSWKDLMEAEE